MKELKEYLDNKIKELYDKKEPEVEGHFNLFNETLKQRMLELKMVLGKIEEINITTE